MNNSKLKLRVPYANTVVPVEKTKAKLELLLRNYGVEKVVWANQGQDEALLFEIQTEINGVKRGLTVQIKQPHIAIGKRQCGRLVHSENRNQEWRLVYHWVKSKLEAVTWGISTLEREFLSEVTMKLADGRSGTVSEVVLDLLSENKLQSLPFIDQAEQKQERRMIVEGEMKT